jgi:KUP system potassium uptake protein
MTTWRRGREILSQKFRDQIVPLNTLFARLRKESVERVPGTAVFLTSSRDGAPPALMRNFAHNHVLHERVLLVTITTAEEPRVPEAERYGIEDLGEGLIRVVAHYGFMQQPNVPALLHRVMGTIDWESTTFFLGRETLITSNKPQLAHWRALLFVFLARNSQPATQFFKIPPARVMEVGAQIEL